VSLVTCFSLHGSTCFADYL